MNWYDTLEGGILQKGTIDVVSGGEMKELGNAFWANKDKEWVVLLRKE